METLDQLRRRIDAATDLRSVVKTMKALAAVSIQHFQEAAASLQEYDRTIAAGLQVVLQHRPEGLEIPRSPGERRLGAVVIGTDQGMCGQFNEQIAGHALEHMDNLDVPVEDRMVLAVGVRAHFALHDAGQPVAETYAIPSSLSGTAPMVEDILVQVEQWRAASDVDRFIVYYNEPLTSATHQPTSRQIVPIDLDWLREIEARPWTGRSIPTFTVDWDRLFATLIRQYLLVSVYRALVESLTSEAAARLTAMQAAESNIQDRLGEFNAAFHHLRQTSITEELLDIIGGFEALGGQDW